MSDRKIRLHCSGRDNLDREKKEFKKLAKDLRYPNEVLKAIDNANSVYELDRIMKRAREGIRVDV